MTWSRSVLVYLLLTVGAALTLGPFLLAVSASLKTTRQFATGTPLAPPNPFTLANYTGLADAGFGRAALVTVLMTAIIVIGQLTFSVLAAYAFARLRFPGRDGLFWVYLATLMIPATVTVVTSGGPQNRTDLAAHRVYAEAFEAAHVGRSAAMSLILFLILVTITVIQHRYFRTRVSYDLV
ncbi:Probable sugar ABC transporter%2C permease protein [Mycobacteroides abscessus]|nr:Probable sugar ABC transporter%2C permease protein [Mycobacteroides abscessus]